MKRIILPFSFALSALFLSLCACCQNIEQIEYWINEDPGFGEAIQITNFTPDLNLEDVIETVMLNPDITIGTHILGIRSKNVHGKWSHTNIKTIEIIPPSSTPDIVALEYLWITNSGTQGDDGFEMETIIFPVTSAPTIVNWIFTVPAPEVSGNHTFLVRSIDENGRYSHTNWKSTQVQPLSGNVFMSDPVYACEFHELQNGMIIYNDTTLTDYLSNGSSIDEYTTDINIINIDAAITSTGGTLFAMQDNASYQWYDCDTQISIAGATAQSFTPEITGNYQVEITVTAEDGTGCSTLSECTNVIINSIDDIGREISLSIYPNPATDQFTYSTNADFSRLEIYDSLGRMVHDQILINPEGKIKTTSWTNGMYTLRFIGTNQIHSLRILVE